METVDNISLSDDSVYCPEVQSPSTGMSDILHFLNTFDYGDVSSHLCPPPASLTLDTEASEEVIPGINGALLAPMGFNNPTPLLYYPAPTQHYGLPCYNHDGRHSAHVNGMPMYHHPNYQLPTLYQHYQQHLPSQQNRAMQTVPSQLCNKMYMMGKAQYEMKAQGERRVFEQFHSECPLSSRQMDFIKILRSSQSKRRKRRPFREPGTLSPKRPNPFPFFDDYC